MLTDFVFFTKINAELIYHLISSLFFVCKQEKDVLVGNVWAVWIVCSAKTTGDIVQKNHQLFYKQNERFSFDSANDLLPKLYYRVNILPSTSNTDG